MDFFQGGMQVQINVLDPKVLEEAMADPESHRNLLVRISGYSDDTRDRSVKWTWLCVE